jgi:hypothetical protein
VFLYRPTTAEIAPAHDLKRTTLLGSGISHVSAAGKSADLPALGENSSNVPLQAVQLPGPVETPRSVALQLNLASITGEVCWQ